MMDFDKTKLHSEYAMQEEGMMIAQCGVCTCLSWRAVTTIFAGDDVWLPSIQIAMGAYL